MVNEFSSAQVMVAKLGFDWGIEEREREREREKCEHGCPNWGFFRGVPGFMCIYVIGINIWRGFFIQIGPLPNWEGNTFVFIG